MRTSEHIDLDPSPNDSADLRKRRRAATPAQIRGNRENAKKSTGPRSPEGKAICALNALRHGCSSGRFYMVAPEQESEYRQLVAQLHADYQPATALESMLLERMAQHHWIMQRATRDQGACITDLFIVENLNGFLRYLTTHERAFTRALADHLKLRKERQKEEIGSVSQNQRKAAAPPEPVPEKTPEVRTATAQAADTGKHQPASAVATAPAIGFESQQFPSITDTSTAPPTGNSTNLSLGGAEQAKNAA